VVQSEEWAIALVAAGVGVAIVPAGVRVDRHVTLRELSDVNVSRQVGIAHRTKRALGAEALRFMEDARRVFGGV
jgi:DNA-binding transcriptional LysR family regulator